jgi:hypothetical protein
MDDRLRPECPIWWGFQYDVMVGRLLDLGLSPYAAYRKTPECQTRRRAILNRAKGTCEGCRRSDDLEVHHLHYYTVGSEKPEDLRALCRSCHEEAHSDRRRDVGRPCTRTLDDSQWPEDCCRWLWYSAPFRSL